MRLLLIFAAGLFVGVCFGLAVFWSTNLANGMLLSGLGVLTGGWGWYVDRKVFG